MDKIKDTPRILIVDDVTKNIQVVANILKPHGYHINFAQDGKSALESVNLKYFDLILLDVMMPGMDGFQVCQLIKKNKKTAGIPIIFLTAKTDSDSIAKAFKVGGVDYVTKPFNPSELIARVKTHIELQKSYVTISEQNAKLKELNAAKDKFFSLIAHDLRNPFNGLIVLTDILRTRYDHIQKNEIEQMINLIHNASKDGYELLENLLTWSRSQRNKITFSPTLVDIQALVKGNIQLLSNIAGIKNIEIENTIEKSIQMKADSNMMDTILRNLITNAIKFTHTGGKIFIRAEVKNKWVQISVEDTGIGLKPKEVEKLFKIDSKKTTLGTAEEKGTGLGLILCKEFVEKHNGKIWAESILGKGSTFFVKLPLS